ncbi:uncharacterized protein SPPG_07752 [Spizellomyces punctatus DAOM BR117]|uniref:Uncharacterized protein n=1 Tax=Spizellomyces punctatus (strain DAOM BR117) TaxID=645134 RepID=A0A0L0H6Q9_SPIPD|nr:uncharacterized protein SPPG_07752 [Spizellomyces punctatus DAOM BR117]KNC96927.1 hypothetical protein SPPG_07752 [Spizellomyces punctatus DAOM BR117]|eukprot:XP_016604967.1 hypothetical protein SPPG_07752 [Spizellomyces punctatus DAOM BR117]
MKGVVAVAALAVVAGIGAQSAPASSVLLGRQLSSNPLSNIQSSSVSLPGLNVVTAIQDPPATGNVPPAETRDPSTSAPSSSPPETTPTNPGDPTTKSPTPAPSSPPPPPPPPPASELPTSTRVVQPTPKPDEGNNPGQGNQGDGKGENGNAPPPQPAPEQGKPEEGKDKGNGNAPEQPLVPAPDKGNEANKDRIGAQEDKKPNDVPFSSVGVLPVAATAVPTAPAGRFPGPISNAVAPTQAPSNGDPNAFGQPPSAPPPGKILSTSAMAGLISVVGIACLAGVVAAGLLVQRRRRIDDAHRSLPTTSGPGPFSSQNQQRESVQSSSSVTRILARAFPDMFANAVKAGVTPKPNVPMVPPPVMDATPQRKLERDISLPPLHIEQEEEEERRTSTIERAVTAVFDRSTKSPVMMFNESAFYGHLPNAQIAALAAESGAAFMARDSLDSTIPPNLPPPVAPEASDSVTTPGSPLVANATALEPKTAPIGHLNPNYEYNNSRYRFSADSDYTDYTTLDRSSAYRASRIIDDTHSDTTTERMPRDSAAYSVRSSRRASWFTDTSGFDTYRRSFMSTDSQAGIRRSLQLRRSMDASTQKAAPPQSSILAALNHMGANVDIPASSYDTLPTSVSSYYYEHDAHLDNDDTETEDNEPTLTRPPKNPIRSDTLRSGTTGVTSESFATALESHRGLSDDEEWDSMDRNVKF